MKKVITVKQVDRLSEDRREIFYQIIKLQNTVAWKIGEELTRADVNEILTNKIAEMIVT